jgi:hypothetical protein
MKLTVEYHELSDEQKLRSLWGHFCDADAVPPEFADEMEAAGLIELQFLSVKDGKQVMDEDLNWVAKYGTDVPTSIYVLTDAGHSALQSLGANHEQ